MTEQSLLPLANTVSLMLRIDSYARINTYLHLAVQIPNEVYLVSHGHRVNGKSLMSVLNLNLTEPVTVYNIPIQMRASFAPLAS